MIFFDASAIVKAYVDEQGSPLVHAAIARLKGRLYLTSAVVLEVLATLARRRRAGDLNQSMYRSVRSAFLTTVGVTLSLLELRDTDFTIGYELVDSHRQIGAGAMDVLHVASALNLQKAARNPSLIVISSDHAFLTLARAAGLQTFNPETGSLATLHALVRAAGG